MHRAARAVKWLINASYIDSQPIVQRFLQHCQVTLLLHTCGEMRLTDQTCDKSSTTWRYLNERARKGGVRSKLQHFKDKQPGLASRTA